MDDKHRNIWNRCWKRQPEVGGRQHAWEWGLLRHCLTKHLCAKLGFHSLYWNSVPCIGYILRREQAGRAGLARQNVQKGTTCLSSPHTKAAGGHSLCPIRIPEPSAAAPSSAESKKQSRAVRAAALRLRCAEMKAQVSRGDLQSCCKREARFSRRKARSAGDGSAAGSQDQPLAQGHSLGLAEVHTKRRHCDGTDPVFPFALIFWQLNLPGGCTEHVSTRHSILTQPVPNNPSQASYQRAAQGYISPGNTGSM